MSKETTCLHKQQIDLLLSRHEITPETPGWQKKYIRSLIISKIARAKHHGLFVTADFLWALLFIWVCSIVLAICKKDTQTLLILVGISVFNVIVSTVVQWFIDKRKKVIEEESNEYLAQKL